MPRAGTRHGKSFAPLPDRRALDAIGPGPGRLSVWREMPVIPALSALQ